MRIDPENWLKNEFAKVRIFADVLRYPNDLYETLSTEEKDTLRQTQVELDEVIRVLAINGTFSLILKYDGVIGWLPQTCLEPKASPEKFCMPTKELITPLSFLNSWLGTKYVWGGITGTGIDCSGFTQRYFLDVHGKGIPKNSRNQRKFAQKKQVNELQDHDLIFCHKLTVPRVHHVALFYSNSVWHARVDEGVTRQSMELFLELYEIEEVGTIL
jgi:hypothetical protein